MQNPLQHIRLLKRSPGVLVALVFAVISGIVGISILITMQVPNSLEQAVTVEFKRGSTIRVLANQLEQHDLLSSPGLFILWGRVKGVASHLQAGEYIIKPGATLSKVLDDVVSGRVRQYSLTLVEGWTFKQFMQVVRTHHAVNHSLSDLSNEQIMETLGLKGLHPEGRFFPDTYFIHKNITEDEVLLRAYNIMEQNLQALWEDRDADLPFKNSYEALILASIVEKESAVPDERPIIAGVFINRLRKGMRLQTDPTVIYGIGDKYDGDIRFRDLRNDTPYNTYTRKGLTPTPIAMPGVGALEAVMHPSKTEFLFFVAINDNSGRHKFSSTLKEHEKAVDLYQRHARKANQKEAGWIK
jgi:UPF0755 protein